MNIEEAIKYFEDKRKDYIVSPSVIHVSTVEVINILKQIKLDKPKPEIPQFVADWIETVKSLGFDLYELLEGPADNSLEEWITNEDNQELIVKARLFGYTVEKEKLYTVEIPNPNDKQIALRLKKWVDGKVIIIATHSSNNFTNDMLLTEQEIRKDFEWAWQQKFAKEVTE
ncbi:phage protein [Streptococcus equi subsp. equi]|uniref:Phage protein n=1 Tax=Streptococcus equi subsp. equi TaxID=148942 RepID=A0A380JNB1_9STRE|nr:DUF1642 domain-containing protein [Streptococcus equi]SUN44635.1 phage protein [Streptococcus equi subsp. equi]